MYKTSKLIKTTLLKIRERILKDGRFYYTLKEQKYPKNMYETHHHKQK